MDKRILEALIHKFDGGPVGLNSLAVAVGEDAGTLEDVHEPYLIMQGYIKRTPQGRVAHAARPTANSASPRRSATANFSAKRRGRRTADARASARQIFGR